MACHRCENRPSLRSGVALLAYNLPSFFSLVVSSVLLRDEEHTFSAVVSQRLVSYQWPTLRRRHSSFGFAATNIDPIRRDTKRTCSVTRRAIPGVTLAEHMAQGRTYPIILQSQSKHDYTRCNLVAIYAFVLHIRRLETTYDVILRCDWGILGLPTRDHARWETRDLSTLIGVAEERNGLPCRCDTFRLTDGFGRRRHDAMKSRAEDIVAPASEQVTGIDNDRPRLLSFR